MRIALLAGVAGLALAAAACNNNQADNGISAESNLAGDPAANDVLGANAVTENEAGVAMPTDANGFATAVAASDLYEIESARLAANRSQSTEIKELASHLLTDHQKSTEELKTLAAKADVQLTPALDAEKQRMLDQLKGARGAQFDRLFVEQQETAHRNALALLRFYASGGDSEPLKAFARKTSGVVEGHIEHVNGIRQTS